MPLVFQENFCSIPVCITFGIRSQVRHTHTYTHTRQNTQKQTNTHKKPHTYVLTHALTHTHTHTHTNTHTHKHARTYTHTRTHSRGLCALSYTRVLCNPSLAIVTGGNRGIGRAIVQGLWAHGGFHIVIACRRCVHSYMQPVCVCAFLRTYIYIHARTASKCLSQCLRFDGGIFLTVAFIRTPQIFLDGGIH